MELHNDLGAHQDIHRWLSIGRSARRLLSAIPPAQGFLLRSGTDAPGGVRPSDFPALTDLAPEDSADPLSRLASALSRQQRRRLLPMEPRRHRRLQIREHRSSLLTARRHHRPDPLAPAVAALAPRPLRDQAVDHHEPDRLLRQVVRRLDPGRRDEPEIALPMRLEPLRQVGRWPASPARRCVPSRNTSVPRRLQPRLELPRRPVASRRWITANSPRRPPSSRSP